MCLLLRVVLLLVHREQLDQLRRHQRDVQSAGLPVVPMLPLVGVVSLRLYTHKQLIPSRSLLLHLCTIMVDFAFLKAESK